MGSSAPASRQDQDGGEGRGKWTKEEREEAEEEGGRRKGRWEGKRWGKADNERCTYQQVPTAVLATLRSGGTEEDGPFMHVGRCGQRREEMRSTTARKSMNKPKKRKGKEGRNSRASPAIPKACDLTELMTIEARSCASRVPTTTTLRDQTAQFRDASGRRSGTTRRMTWRWWEECMWSCNIWQEAAEERGMAEGGGGTLLTGVVASELQDGSVGRVRGGEGGGRLAPAAHRVQEEGECEGGRASEWRGKRPAGRNRRRWQRRNQDARALAFWE
ncbi:hypothetical protein B0H13DRAFT_1924413 [Mycena leptocephala]|nr:hypothetical protein B0H13DRAFT_1924413 [Mycena leptocephala]